MEKKLLLIIKEDIVVYARLFDAAWIEKTSPVFPYRNNDAPGNPYARALRLRDHNIKRGTPVEVLVLDEDDIRKYYYKRYNAVTKEFSLINETEEERQTRIDDIDTFFGLEQEDYDGIEYMKPDYSVYQDVISEDMYDKLRTRVRKHEMFSDDEFNAIEAALPQLDGDRKNRAIYTIAAHQSRVCIDPIVGKIPVDRGQEHIKETRATAIKWWFKLMRSSHEKKALMEIARIYSWSEEESKAVDVYRDMLNRADVSAEEKESIRRRIEVLGSGRDIFDEAQSLYDNGSYDECISKVDEFSDKSSGAVKTFLRQKANNLKGLCLIEQAKVAESFVEKDYLKESALRLMYPERYLGDGGILEWREKRKKEEDNVSDRDYFDSAE